MLCTLASNSSRRALIGVIGLRSSCAAIARKLSRACSWPSSSAMRPCKAASRSGCGARIAGLLTGAVLVNGVCLRHFCRVLISSCRARAGFPGAVCLRPPMAIRSTVLKQDESSPRSHRRLAKEATEGCTSGSPCRPLDPAGLPINFSRAAAPNNRAPGSRMGGRAVEGTGLENRRARKGTVGSNPTPSAILELLGNLKDAAPADHGESGSVRAVDCYRSLERQNGVGASLRAEKLELRAITKSHGSREIAVVISSTMPSAKYSCSGSPLIFAKGNTAIDGLSGRDSGGDGGANVLSAAATPDPIDAVRARQCS